MRFLYAFGLALVAATPALAADSWGLDHEKPVQERGTVVDLLCELAGDCPEECGGGQRQLGLLTEDGRLLPAVKSNTLFAGPVLDLLPHCGRTVEADGLVIENPAMTLFFVQGLRTDEGEAFAGTDAFGEAYQAQFGDEGEWFREHPRIKEVIAEDGVLGDPSLDLAQ